MTPAKAKPQFDYDMADLPRCGVHEIARAEAPCFARLSPKVDLIALPNVDMRSDFTAYAGGLPVCGERLYMPYVRSYYETDRIKATKRFPEVSALYPHLGPAYIVTHFNMLTYGHFLLEVLPKLFVVKGLYDMGLRFPIVMPACAPGYAAIVKAVHPGFDVLSYHSYQTRVCFPLGLFPSVMTTPAYRFNDWFVSGVNELSRRFGDGRAQRKIFISREGWKSFRTLENEAELAAIAQQHGFEVVRPQELEWSEQVAMFARATRVIGEYTSALHNTMFCPEGVTRVLSLHKLNGVQDAIAECFRHQMDYLIPEGAPPQFRIGWSETMSFKIDPAAFEARLAGFLAEP